MKYITFIMSSEEFYYLNVNSIESIAPMKIRGSLKIIAKTIDGKDYKLKTVSAGIAPMGENIRDTYEFAWRWIERLIDLFNKPDVYFISITDDGLAYLSDEHGSIEIDLDEEAYKTTSEYLHNHIYE